MIAKSCMHHLRIRLELEGVLQGVGFRPFVYNLAKELKLTGFVLNSSEGVLLEIEGPDSTLEEFVNRLKNNGPPHAEIHQLKKLFLPCQNSPSFEICVSQVSSQSRALILPDLAICSECRFEIFDSTNRRYLYPFTNCTHCGPRYSIIESLPYDRKNTSMKKFRMCLECQREYDNPSDRRFHAQPNACPECGPHIQIWNSQGNSLGIGHDALLYAVGELRSGKILALKGLGGFQLLADAKCENAVQLLRKRKHRSEKPFAIMLPDITMVKIYCDISSLEEESLLSAQAPIVLCRKRQSNSDFMPIAHSVSLNNSYLGVMLPYTPLHEILLQQFAQPLVATSANLSEEPMCIDNFEAVEKLNEIADCFLVHDRPIVRPVDDSVGMEIGGKFSITRRARGYAPLPIYVGKSGSNGLALGGQMKNTIALKIEDKVYLSQHIGDLHSAESELVFNQSIESIRSIYPESLDFVATDLHPDYLPSRQISNFSEPAFSIQHHHAHIVSCMAENNLQGPVLGLAWDGTGFGLDQVIWGSEFLISTRSEFDRVAHLLPFRLPGGEAAIRQPKRTALGLLAALSDNKLDDFIDLPFMKFFSKSEIRNTHKLLENGFRAPYTTSMGRLFDGISGLLGLCENSNYEGQAAILLEQAINGCMSLDSFNWNSEKEKNQEFLMTHPDKYILDWRPMVREIISAIRLGEGTGLISTKFHNTLVQMALAMAKKMGILQVVLSGGCFQNKFLTENLISHLRSSGFEVYWHSQVPTNDGGISLGQAIIAAARCNKREGF